MNKYAKVILVQVLKKTKRKNVFIYFFCLFLVTSSTKMINNSTLLLLLLLTTTTTDPPGQQPIRPNRVNQSYLINNTTILIQIQPQEGSNTADIVAIVIYMPTNTNTRCLIHHNPHTAIAMINHCHRHQIPLVIMCTKKTKITLQIRFTPMGIQTSHSIRLPCRHSPYHQLVVANFVVMWIYRHHHHHLHQINHFHCFQKVLLFCHSLQRMDQTDLVDLQIRIIITLIRINIINKHCKINFNFLTRHLVIVS